MTLAMHKQIPLVRQFDVVFQILNFVLLIIGTESRVAVYLATAIVFEEPAFVEKNTFHPLRKPARAENVP